MVLPHDGSPTMTAVLGPALELARRADAELLVLHLAASGLPPSSRAPSLPHGMRDQAHYERPTWASEFLQRALLREPARGNAEAAFGAHGGRPGSGDHPLRP